MSSSFFPLGYDVSALSPILVIKDLDGIEQFRYETPQVIAGTPVQDFQLVGGLLKKGVNTDHGSFTFNIRDDNQLLIDKDTPIFASKIKQGWEVELFLGKDPTTVNLWFRGIINVVKSNTQTKTFTLSITCFGYGVITASRYSSMNRTQIKLDDEVTPDPADLSTKNTELFKDVLEDTDHLTLPGLGLLDIIPSDVEDLPPQMGDYRKNFVTLGSELNELAQMVGAYWGVNADKTAFLRQRGSLNSDFLITNDVDNASLTTINWNQQKIAFTKADQVLIRRDSTQSSGVTVMHGVGSQKQIVDHEQTTSDNLIDLSLKNYAFPFIPEKDNISQVSLYLVRAGVLTAPLVISIVGENPDVLGTPNFLDLRETKIIQAATLEIELSITDRNIDIKFNKIPVTVGEQLFLVLEKSANDLTFLTGEYLQDVTPPGPPFYYESDDLETWIPQNGDPRFITYQSKTVRIVGQNTTTQKFLRPKESIVTLPDQPDEETILAIFESILEAQSKIISNYEPVTITPPTLPIEMGKCVRFIDVNSGFDRELDVVSYELMINAYDKNSIGATEMKITFQEIYI